MPFLLAGIAGVAVFGLAAKETGNAVEKTSNSVTHLVIAGVAAYFIAKKLKVI